MLAHVGRCCTIGPTISAAPHERKASIFRRSWVFACVGSGKLPQTSRHETDLSRSRFSRGHEPGPQRALQLRYVRTGRRTLNTALLMTP